MKCWSLILFTLTGLNLSAQTIWPDTLRTTVDLKGFKLAKKIVRAEYGKVIMYFNQADYLQTEVKEDTVQITPKYLSSSGVADLLKKGRVKIIRRVDNSVQTRITHYLKQFGSMCDRMFEFSDGVGFFMHLEIVGLMNVYDLNIDLSDTARSNKKDTTVPKKEFAYEEEFPDTSDTTSIKIKDYLPARPSFHYVYNSNMGYGEQDTNICKTRKLNQGDVFYFADCYNPHGIVSVDIHMFGEGLYFYQNDSLFTIDVGYEKDIDEDETGDTFLLIPALIRPGDSTVLDLGWEQRVFTFLKREDLKIGEITHKDCIKLKLMDYWPNTIYVGYAWLKKGFGLVKWMRATGRVEELVDSF